MQEIPGGRMAMSKELVSPVPSHKLIVLAAPLRVHNQTDLTLIIRFLGPQKHFYGEAKLVNFCSVVLESRRLKDVGNLAL